MGRGLRPRGVSAEDEARFGGLWDAAKQEVTGVFSQAAHPEEEGMAQWVWEKASLKFGTALKLERVNRREGREFGWVGWFVMIAVNLLRDEKRRETSFKEKVGRRVTLEARLGWITRDGAREACWREIADERWPCVEEAAEWAVMVRELHGLLGRRPLLDRRVLVEWGEKPNDAYVARRLGVAAATVRRRRVKCLAGLRLELEKMGYTARNRPRQPVSEAWGFARGARGASVTMLGGRKRAA